MEHNLFYVYLFLVYLSISTRFGRLCAHHQEKQLCLCDTWYLLFCMDDCLVCRVHSTLHTRQSPINILRINCAPSWLYLQDYTEIHGQHNVKFYRITLRVYPKSGSHISLEGRADRWAEGYYEDYSLFRSRTLLKSILKKKDWEDLLMGLCWLTVGTSNQPFWTFELVEIPWCQWVCLTREKYVIFKDSSHEIFT